MPDDNQRAEEMPIEEYRTHVLKAERRIEEKRLAIRTLRRAADLLQMSRETVVCDDQRQKLLAAAEAVEEAAEILWPGDAEMPDVATLAEAPTGDAHEEGTSGDGCMFGPEFESIEAARDGLETVHGISPKLLDELFDEIDEAAPDLVGRYDLEDTVDLEVVRESLKIAFCEDIAVMYDHGVWDDADDIRRVIDDMEEFGVSNCTMLVGRVAGRHEDMMRLSGAIIKETLGDE